MPSLYLEPQFKANLESIREWLDDVEAKKMIRDKMGEFSDYIQHLVTVKSELLLSDAPEWFKETGCEVINDKIAKKRKEILQLDYKVGVIEGKRSFVKKAINLDEIKAIPIADIMPCEPKIRSANRLFYLAPYRNETQPSLCVYVDKNRFYDFGESVGGTTIDLYMKINDCDFKTAISELSKLLT